MSKFCTVQEEFYPHEHLWRSANALTELVEADKDNSYRLLLPAILTTFLAYEAFVNFCGHVLLPDLWAKEKESFKGKSLEDKLEKICTTLPQFRLLKGERPYQTIKNLSRFRELVAHGKVQVNEYITEQKRDATHFTFEHEWDTYLTTEQLNLFRADVKKFCESLLVVMRKSSDYPHIIFPAFEGSLASGESVSINGKPFDQAEQSFGVPPSDLGRLLI
jgi:hypothetical protein